MSIKAIYVGKYHEQETLCAEVYEKNTKIIKTDIGQIGSKIRALNSKSGARDKLKTAYGVWYATHINGNIYGVCTSENYPQRLVFKMITEIREYMQKSKPRKPQLLNFVNSQYHKMKDATKVDKVSKAQQQVNMLQNDLNLGIKKIMQNQEQLTELDDHAIQLKSLATQFHQNAENLQSITCWKKWKFIFLIASIIVGFISIIIITILIRT